MIAVGLALALGSAVGIGGGYALQHSSASQLPPLALRRPVYSVRLLLSSGRWTWGLLAGIVGWVLYVVALRLAPLSLVQAASAGGIGVLAFSGGRLSRSERVGVGAAFGGLILLALSVGSHPPTGRGDVTAVAVWVGVSSAAAGVLAWRWRSSGAALGTAAGVLYAAGDVATKAAVVGGARLAFVPVILACQGVAFVCLQLAFQRGSSLASGGLTVLWTNSLPIAAGMALFSEPLPGGVRGGLRVAAFALVLAGGVALSRRAPGFETVESGIVD
jgi:hypothetical protein